jgi:O-antigen/teichoic acid export membrane protein
MARGAAWMVLMRLVIRAAGLVNMVILARLLVPEDFGLIAMAMLVVGAIDIVSEFNFDVVLIKKQAASRADYDTAWTLSIIRGAVVCLLLIAVADPAAELFDEPRLAAVAAVLALSPLLLGLQNIGVVDFRKRLDFRRDFLLMAGAKVVAVVVTVGLALIW